jgi:hypothetical protein
MQFRTLSLSFLPFAALVTSLAPVSGQTLTGETFISTTLQVVGNCSDPIKFGMSFSAGGIASAPVPGTFSESGSFVFNQGDVFFDASFNIQPQNVKGTKRFDPTLPVSIKCIENLVDVEGYVRYDTDTGDQGIATVRIFGSRVNTSDSYTGVFEETFVSAANMRPAAVFLSPAAAENPVGTSHTVTAMVVNELGQPVSGVTVNFTVSGSVNTTGSCTTDANGECSFTYQGPQFPGADIITAEAEGVRSQPATKVWFLPASTPGQVTGGGHILHNLSITGVSFGFTAQNDTLGGNPKGGGMVVDHTANTKIKLLDVTTLIVAGTHATFFGNAEINGAATRYRIDVDDLAEPGRFTDTFKIQTDSGYVAGGVLTGGNIQIHK